jgi:penicillin-binding protein 2
MKKKTKMNRYTALTLLTCFMFTIILVRLYSLQIVQAEDFQARVDRSSRATFFYPAPRGEILDSNGILLAGNKQTYVLVYNNTELSRRYFFQTMAKVFEIFDDHGEIQRDNLPIYIDAEDGGKIYFDFKQRDENTARWMELRFKKDRGFDDAVIRRLYGNNNVRLTDEMRDEVDEELMKITAEEVFERLIADYRLNTAETAGLSNEEKRRYMLIRDDLKMATFSGKSQVTIANIHRDTAFIFYQMLNELPGIDITTEPLRHYPFGELGSAFLGYTSKIPSWQQSSYIERGYDLSRDFVGMGGLESHYESVLRGSKGEVVAHVNRLGRIVSELGRKDPYPGNTLHLTVNKDVQAMAERALDQTLAQLQQRPPTANIDTKNATRGAAVVIDVNTGGIIAMASRPGYDPNLFAAHEGLSPEVYRHYFNLNTEELALEMGYTPEQIDRFFPLDTSIRGNTTIRQDMYDILPKPLFNYATQSFIPPGSTFKVLTALVGLETGVITPNTIFYDGYSFDDGNNFKTTFFYGGRGNVNLARALEVSSNPYFMHTAKRLREGFGDDILADYGRRMGLGLRQPSGIEIPERYGQIFNSATIKDNFASSYLWVTLSALNSGNYKGRKYIPFDLYLRDTDSATLRGIKNEFRNQIQTSIRSGIVLEHVYKDLINKIIETDPIYRDKEFTPTIIDTIYTVIRDITRYDAYFQTIVPANIYNASIGQGINSFTPLEMANFVATLVNGGNRYKLHFVDKITAPNGNIIRQTVPEVMDSLDLNPRNVEAVKHGMYLTNHGASGTADRGFRRFPIATGGKTGSATFSNDQKTYGRTAYGWYIGFAPYENPEIAVAVVIFDGGSGGQASPVALGIFEEYFRAELELNHPNYVYRFEK